MVFSYFDHPVDGRRKIMWLCNAKIDISVFIFVGSGVIFPVMIIFSYRSFNISPIVGKVEDDRPDLDRELVWSGYTETNLLDWKSVLCKGEFCQAV